jgi:hypothetical protein
MINYLCTVEILATFNQQLFKVKNLLDRVYKDKDDLCTIYPSVSPKRDARITAFHKVGSALCTFQLSLVFLTRHLFVKEWWQEISKGNMPDSSKITYIERYIEFAKIGYIQIFFSAIDSSFRLLLRNLDPTACRSGMAEFKSVCDCLLTSKLNFSIADSQERLNLFRLLRNVIHNNGVFFNPKGEDVIIKLDGVTYEFKQGLPVNFVTIDFILEQSDAIRNILFNVMIAPIFRNIQSEIFDPYFSNTNQ